jgi:NADH-quinone oxidoreductase subunit G
VPQIKQGGEWHRVDWQTALDYVAKTLKDIVANHGAESIGALLSPHSTLEELYLATLLAEGLGSAHLDHRLRRRDFRHGEADASVPGLGLPIAAVERLDGLLVIGSNLRQELPILAHRVRSAAMRGARVSFVNPAPFEYRFPVAHSLTASPDAAVEELAALLAAAAALGRPLGDVGARIRAALEHARPGEQHHALVESLAGGTRAVWLGALALRSSRYVELRALARALARTTGASFGELAEGANAV